MDQPSKARPSTFLIYGHDDRARQIVERFVQQHGVDVVPFYRAGAEPNAMAQVLKKVLNGIKEADLVIALLTPDEQAAWHDPSTGRFQESDDAGFPKAGWQPRPNVLLETGIAVGTAQEKTILLKAGNIRQISDLDGVLKVALDEDDAQVKFSAAIVEKLAGRFAIVPPRQLRKGPLIVRKRWKYYDELGQLATDLTETRIYRRKSTLYDVVEAYVVAHPDHGDWSATTLMDFAHEKFDKERNNGESTDAMFWWFFNYGLLQLKEADGEWHHELWWVNMLEHVFLTPRATALFTKVASLER